MNQTMKKGMSLVEVVVAMTLVVLISFAALSAVLFGVNSIENQQYRQYAVNEAENIISCLQSDEPNGALRDVYGVGVEDIDIDKDTSWIFCFPNAYYDDVDSKITVCQSESEIPSDSVVSVMIKIDKYGNLEELRADALYIKTGSASLRRAFSYFPHDDMQIPVGSPENPLRGDS